MNTAQYNHLFSFIWNIANDVLVHAFEKGEYKKIIMPMMVLRRLDILLEPTKEKVLEKKAVMDKAGIANQEPVMFSITGYPFCNTSRFTMKKLKAEVDPLRLKMNFIEYLNGYSKDVQDIIDKFKLRQQVDNLTEAGRLGSIIDKFTDSSINLSIKPVLDDNGNEILPALDNHMMGTLFEELLRKFNEENNVTEAGEHFTPRDYVKLLADLAVMPVADLIEDTTYGIYDGACGTGGILTLCEEQIKRIAEQKGKRVNINIFGQELQPETYATCKADLMISGGRQSFNYTLNGQNRQFIAFGSTISQDGHSGETFDFCISNPPFGTPWKEDLKIWGLAENEKKKISDPRFRFSYKGDGDFNVIPGIGDPQMLFLANNISRMKTSTKLGTRIVEVHNVSSLYNGNAGSGESNLRRYILENDLLEAIVAMPENDFYNTGIVTYIWVLSNRKEDKRKGKVQLIDATQIKSPLRKNLGKKNCETTAMNRDAILKLYLDYQENDKSKIVNNEDFGYWEVPVSKPCYDDNGFVIKDKKGKVKRKFTKDPVIVPFSYVGGVKEYFKNEIEPYNPDFQACEPKVGYEINFLKYFLKPKRANEQTDLIREIKILEKTAASISEEILQSEEEISRALTEGISKSCSTKDSGIPWIGQIPSHWDVIRLRGLFEESDEKTASGEETLLSLSQYTGVTPKADGEKTGMFEAESTIGYKVVHSGQFVMNIMLAWNGSYAVSNYDGIISPAYCVFNFKKECNKKYYDYLLRTKAYADAFKTESRGIIDSRLRLYPYKFYDFKTIMPPIEEQNRIVEFIDTKCNKIEQLSFALQEEIKLLNKYKQLVVGEIAFGQLSPINFK